MSSNHRFFKCELCGNVTGLIMIRGGALACCGQNMTELIPNTVDASAEKHVPAVTRGADKISVQVGSVPHPMEEDHHIAFIYVETERGGQRKCTKRSGKPSADFTFTDDSPSAVYAYCNLHGLWELGL